MPRTLLSLPRYPQESFYGKLDTAGRRSPTLEDCVAWLKSQKLLIEGDVTPPLSPENDAGPFIESQRKWGVRADHATPKTHAELKAIKEHYKSQPLPNDRPSLDSSEAVSRLWDDYKNGPDAIQKLSVDPVPADAIACYRPFHVSPGDWGIYVSVQRLLELTGNLCEAFSDKLYVLGNLESIVSCVLFEVFHHEFFHHMVESAATALEILSAAFGSPRPFYRDYVLSRAYTRTLGPHPHEPLEEALANAYAHNSFSFISRVKLGYQTIETKHYQKVVRKTWRAMGPGYRDAEYYVVGRNDTSNSVTGAAELLAMLFSNKGVDPASLLLVAKEVMPRGHTAFMAKAQIPTLLVGYPEVLDRFYDLIPAPNETYTQLFWARDTTKLDEALRGLQKKEKQEQADRKKAKKKS